MEAVEMATPGSDLHSTLLKHGMEKAGDGSSPQEDQASATKLEAAAPLRSKRGPKRKRSLFAVPLDEAAKAGLVEQYRKEMAALVRFYKEEEGVKFAEGSSREAGDGAAARRGEIAVLVEESVLPFSALVQQIWEKVGGGVTLASVRSSVLSIGERVNFGLTREDADVLEDSSEDCLWRWEVRDVKLLPASARGEVADRRKRRRKISERLVALAAAVGALTAGEMDPTWVNKTKEALAKADDEAAIRTVAEERKQRRDVRKQTVAEEEKGSKEAEKAKMREKKEMEKAEKVAAKEVKRMEREKLEHKQKLALQRQAGIMGRFLKLNKDNVTPEVTEAAVNSSSPQSNNKNNACEDEQHEQASQGSGAGSTHVEIMDRQIVENGDLDVERLWKCHLSAWRSLSRREFGQRWGLRRHPKVSLYRELRLLGSGEGQGKSSCVSRKRDRGEFEGGDDGNEDKGEGESGETDCVEASHEPGVEEGLRLGGLRKCQRKRRKLLQFDKSHRPAYYGTLSKKSDVVSARRPLKKDSLLDYEVESDEEWEEEDPGESLSDCEKDEEDDKGEAEEEDESSDGFMVPDGYLSESEGVHLEEIDSDDGEETPSPRPKSSFGLRPGLSSSSDEFNIQTFERLQKVLDNATDHAARFNRPLLINMLRREQDAGPEPGGAPADLTKTQRMCLQALRCLTISPKVLVEPPEDLLAIASVPHIGAKRGRKKRIFAWSDSANKEFVQLLMSSSNQGLKKTKELLIEKFPQAPKGFLHAKIHEVAKYVDSKWQLKPEVLEQQGLAILDPTSAYTPVTQPSLSSCGTPCQS